MTLSPNTQYFFYCDTRPNGPGGTTILGDGYSGGTFLKSANGNSGFVTTAFADVAFNLQGDVVASPEPSTIGLEILAFGTFSILGVRRNTSA